MKFFGKCCKQNIHDPIASFNDLSMAYIARSKLESAGIPCVLENEYFVSMHWLYSNAVGGVTLKVPEYAASEAAMLLGEDTGSVAEQEPDGSEKVSCPRCGGAEFTSLSLGKAFAALSWLVGIPLPVAAKRYRCRNCGALWKNDAD